MPALLRASLVVVGDEILDGFVPDTNSGWLATRLREHGVPLDRVVTVPDDLAAIGEALHGELGRGRPRLVATSGGIGSTPDDVTLEAVAAALGQDLVEHPDLGARIDAVVAAGHASGAPLSDGHARSLRKMAQVPAAATVLPGAGGVAPGVAVDVDGGIAADGGATVVVLPGVPSEFRRLVTEVVEPVLLAGRGRPRHVIELRHGYPESALNPVLDELVADHPGVAVGSYPGWECTVRLSGDKAAVETAAMRVRDFLAELDADPASTRMRTAWQERWEG